MKLDEDEYVIGTLSAEDRPQMMLDLVIERKFELSHDWKSGSVYFIGSIADDQIQGTYQLISLHACLSHIILKRTYFGIV